jgi:hypothetical protein
MRNILPLIFSLLMLSLASSCKVEKKSKSADIIKGGNTAPEIESYESYVETFIEYQIQAGGVANVGNSTFAFVNTLSNNVLGTCTMETGYIKINEYLWRQISSARKEELIFHELGHCFLNRYHENSVDPQNYPISIMNWYQLGPSIYATNRYAKYMSELFAVPESTFTGYSFNPARYTSSSNSQFMALETSEYDHSECHFDGDDFTIHFPDDE